MKEGEYLRSYVELFLGVFSENFMLILCFLNFVEELYINLKMYVKL